MVISKKKKLVLAILVASLISAWLVLQIKNPAVGLQAINKKAPDFTLVDMEGNEHTLSQYSGRVVMVNFWATWCPPCREEMPSMQRIWKLLQGDGFVILAVDIGETAEEIEPFVMEYDIDFPILLDPDSKVATAWSARGLPTTYLVDRSGNIAYRAIGGREWDSELILQTIKKMLAEN